MISNLQSLKDDYLLQGGGDPEFLEKVAELEDFLKFRKPLGRAQPKPYVPPLPTIIKP